MGFDDPIDVDLPFDELLEELVLLMLLIDWWDRSKLTYDWTNGYEKAL